MFFSICGMRKVTRYLRRSTINLTAAIALTVGTGYLAVKGDMPSAMAAAGAAVAAFSATGDKESEKVDEESDKLFLEYQKLLFRK
jgi:hypothetical protein